MRYILSQKLFSFVDKFTIQDENERDAYYVEGRMFSFGNKLSFRDMSGNELIFIQQRLMTFSPTYDIYRGGRLYATLKKELFTFFNCRFNIDVVGSYDIQVEGDFFDHEYTFTKNGKEIGRVSKEWFTWSDRYGVEIDSFEDAPFILACAVIIDMICHDNKNNG